MAKVSLNGRVKIRLLKSLEAVIDGLEIQIVVEQKCVMFP